LPEALVDSFEKHHPVALPEGLASEALQEVIRTAADVIPGLVWTSLPDGHIDFMNQRWREYTGLSLDQARGQGWQNAIHPDDLPGLLQTWHQWLASGAPGEALARMRRFDGDYRWCSFSVVPLRDTSGRLVKWYGQTSDVDDMKRAESLLAGEKNLLEMVAKGQPLDHILEVICRLVEQLVPDSMASTMLLDGAPSRLSIRAAPNVPRAYLEAVDGALVDLRAGPCAFSADTGQAILSSDIAVDPRWDVLAEVAVRAGIRACLSMPILSSAGEVLGTLAIYFGMPRQPTPQQRSILDQLTQLTAVAVERARVDAALQASEERFRRMADATPDVMWITELDPERVVYASPSFERIWGRTVEQLYRDPQLWIEGVHADDRGRIREAFAAWTAKVDRGPWEAEFRVVRPDESVRWIHERGIGFADAGGPQRVSGVSTDVTDRRSAELALRESEQRFSLAVAGLADGVWDWNITSDLMYMSEQAQKIYGVEPGPTLRPRNEWLTLMRPSPPKDMALRRAMVADFLAGRIPTFDGEWRVRHANGIDRWVRTCAVCVRDASGRATRLTGSITDIDDRKRAEQALQQSQQRHALAMEAARDGHWDWIVESDEFYASPRLLEIYGFPADTRFTSRQEMLDRFPLHPEDRPMWERAVSEHFAGKTQRFELEMRMLLNGEVRWIQQNGLLSRDAAGRPVRWTGSVRDVTDRKASEAALLESEQRFALAVSGSNDGIWDWDIDTHQMFLSERAQRLYGLEPGVTVRPRAQWRAMVIIHPDFVERQKRAVDDYLAGGPPYDCEWRVLHADGSYRWVRVRGVCVRDESGRAKRMAGSVIDIDAQKRAEAALLQAQRLEATGTLAGGIAHDFNNILAAILGYGEMALRDAPAGTRLRRDLDSILVAAERGRSLVDRILAFSRSAVGERSPVHVEGVVREALELLSATLPDKVRIDTQLTAGMAAMLGDATQIHQVVMNLATNAIQAMPAGGLLSVALRVVDIEAELTATTGVMAPGQYLLLEMADQGIGIKPSILARIFEPFFTTKDTGGGTGLGLSMVHGIVSEVGGAIDVVSQVGAGTRFTVYFPRAGDATDVYRDDGPDLPRGQGQHVLVVDDEASLVALTTETLSDLGYAPSGFVSSLAAWEAFRKQPEAFDAIVTDERMPGMSGSALVREVRGLRSDIPILLLSGFLGGAINEQARAAGADEVLQKPLAARDLATALSRLLPDEPP
jgi:PAS domain S-box-containing protein